MDIDSFETAVQSFKTLYQNKGVLLGAIAGLIFVVAVNLIVPNPQTITSQISAASIGQIFVLFVAVAIVSIIVQPLITGFVIASAYYPKKSTGERLMIAARRWIYLVAGLIVYTVVVLIGLVALIIPGIYIALRLYPYYTAIVAGNCGPIEGAKKAWNMTRGQVWALLSLAIIITVVVFILELAFMAANPIAGSAVGGFIGYAGTVAGVLVYNQLSLKVQSDGRKKKKKISGK